MPVPQKNHNAITSKVQKFPPNFIDMGYRQMLKHASDKAVTHLEDGGGAVSSWASRTKKYSSF